MDTSSHHTLDKNLVIRQDVSEIISSHLNWNALNNKTILITGAGGFLAAYLVKSLLAASAQYGLGVTVICVARAPGSLDKRLQDWMLSDSLVFFQQDLSSPLKYDFPVADVIIHAASQASPKYYGIDPVGTLMPNAVGTAQLLEHARLTGTERFLFVSSGSVYGQQSEQKLRINEKDFGFLDPTDIRSCYAESKRIGENMCVSWSHQYHLHTNIVRPFHTYGPSVALDDGRVFADFVSDVISNRDIVMKSDGLARRAFCYVSDAVIGFLTVLTKGEIGQAYNIGNPACEISIRDLAGIIASLFPERNIKVQVGEHPKDNSYLRSPLLRSCPAVDKVVALGWKPKIDIEDGFRRTIESYLQ